ncbi:hypothetical protein IYY11_04465 [Methylocystis sp. H62]|nr:hypothetical protein [Methylocystis sp. H62]
METKKTSKSFSPDVWDRAVRMVREHQGDYGSEWEAILSIASKIGCTGESLRRWMRQAEWENRELRQANEILRKAYFAQAELDRRFRP